MSSYCDTAPGHPFHGPYHENEYGFPAYGENPLFERLVMEINQAGLSWLTVLKKRAAFFHAFGGFDPAVVAGYGEGERARLLGDTSIIRNRRKIDAAIENARRICTLGEEFGSFAGWLDAHHPLAKAEWVALFRNTFVFTGVEITGEFLMSTGYLPGAHFEDCPVYQRIAELAPRWMMAGGPAGGRPGVV